jgi:phosphonate transport system permease protein
VAVQAVVETLQIAFLGTMLGAVIALPLGLLGSRNLFGRAVTVPSRLVLAGIRTLPALLWAVVFVVAVGLGPLAGVLASAVYTVGYLGKLQYESIEGLDPAPIHAIGASGASRVQVIRYVVLPEGANHLLSQVLFMFEHNVRASSIFGFVGAGGIGFYISAYLTVFQYRSVMTLLLAVFVTILVIDYVSVRLRDRFLVPTRVTHPTDRAAPAGDGQGARRHASRYRWIEAGFGTRQTRDSGLGVRGSGFGVRGLGSETVARPRVVAADTPLSSTLPPQGGTSLDDSKG